jgi:hypothetical protein
VGQSGSSGAKAIDSSGVSHAAHEEKPELFRMILEDFLTG